MFGCGDQIQETVTQFVVCIKNYKIMMLFRKHQLCASRCGKNVTIDHLIVHCPVFGTLWQLVKSWIGVYSVDPYQVTNHFYQFVHSTGGFAQRRSFIHLIWLCCNWVLWNERNHILFAKKGNSTLHLLEKVKISSL